MKRPVLWICLWAMCAGSLPVFAQSPERQQAARSLYEKGRARFEARDFVSAAELFEQSLRLYPTPHARLYRGVSLARSGNCPEAIEVLSAFSLADLPAKAREKGRLLWEEAWRTCATRPSEERRAERSDSPETSGAPIAEPPPPDTSVAPPAPTVEAPNPAVARPPGPPPEPLVRTEGAVLIYRDVAEASGLVTTLEQAPEGARVVLGPGRYRLERPLRITRSLSIQGSGPDRTILVCDGENEVIRFEGSGLFSLSDLAVEHDGVRPAVGIRVVSGEVDFRRIQVTGAIRNAESRRGGQGILVEGATHGQVLSSVFRRNALHGIQAMGTSALRIEGCQFMDNGQTGISWFESAAGAARDNLLEGNGRYGLAVVEPARPQLSGNICRNNRRGGLYLETPDLPLGPGNDCPPFVPQFPKR